jgi:uncharacterized protein
MFKIAADHHSRTHIVAACYSSLAASKRFRDTLAGRKRDLWLAPMCLLDMDFLPEKHTGRDFQEWMDAYWAEDIQTIL